MLALFEVLKAMDDEREDLGSYVNLFGYNPKYGVSGRRIVGVRYEPQSFSKGLTRPELTADTVRETEFSDLTHALCDLTVARAQ